MNWHLLANSLLIAGGTALLACAIGIVAALWLCSCGRKSQFVLLVAGIVTLALPPFLIVNAWLDLANARVNLLNPAATLGILTLLYWPIAMLSVWVCWTRLDPALLEADPQVRGWALLRHVLLPTAQPALGVAGVLTFVLALNNFAVPSIFQTKVYTTEIWIRYSTGLSGTGALVASWPVVLAPLILAAVFVGRGWWWPQTRPVLPPKLLAQQLGKRWLRAAGWFTFLFCLVSLAIPLAQLVTSSESWQSLPGVITAGKTSGWNSVLYASATALLCCGTGLLLAAYPAAKSVKWVLWAIFFLPGSILGIALLAGLNPLLPPGLRDSSLLVLLALFLRHVVIAWTATELGYASADTRLIDNARVDGASGWSLWRHAYWPQAWRHIFAGSYAVYLLCLWEVDSMVLLAPPGGDTLAMRAFNLLHYGHTGEVNGICILLLLLALLPLAGLARCAFQSRVAERQRIRTAALILGICGITSCSPPSGQPGPAFESRTFLSVEVIGTRGAGLGQFTKPRSLALDSDDNLYVSDMTGRVQKFSPSGAFMLSWQMPQTDLGKPKGMCRDADGNVVVIEPHYSRLSHYSPDGKLVVRWGQHGTNTGMLAFPRAAGVNPHGQIYVSEYGLFERVQRFQLHGKSPPQFINSFGSPGRGPGQFNRPEGLCVDPEGRIHVADSCNHRVQVFTADGTFLSSYGVPGKAMGELSYPYDVCVDSSGLRFVCEFGNSRIQVFDPEGRPVEIIGKPGRKPGEFNNPWSIALDAAGNLYVADSQNHRVQKLVRRASSRNTRGRALPKENGQTQKRSAAEPPRN